MSSGRACGTRLALRKIYYAVQHKLLDYNSENSKLGQGKQILLQPSAEKVNRKSRNGSPCVGFQQYHEYFSYSVVLGEVKVLPSCREDSLTLRL